ncbi:MAG: hypothetical protein D6826_05630 [Alphaproteobacteria bacterium]|nr:MAG: hypothetical protein D6826_05630 [Alphaproteobacteria bacterium]
MAGALAAVVAGLGGCEGPPRRPQFPEITFRHLPPIRLDVREIRFTQAYRAPAAAPNVDHLFPVPPADAALRWGRDRLVAAGAGRRGEYVVREASVIEVPLEKSGGLSGLLTTEQSERYDARLVVEMRIVEDDGRVAGTATAEVVRSRSVPEGITLNEREKVWFEMTETLMRELNAQLEKTITTVFAPYVVR